MLTYLLLLPKNNHNAFKTRQLVTLIIAQAEHINLRFKVSSSASLWAYIKFEYAHYRINNGSAVVPARGDANDGQCDWKRGSIE